MNGDFLVTLADAVAVVIGAILAIIFIYTLARLAGKAWYRSKREEDVTVLKIKSVLRRKGGNAYGK